VAAAAVIPGISPFADRPSATADPAPAAVSAAFASGGSPTSTGATSEGGAEVSTNGVSLKTLLGNTVSGDWAPQRSRTEAKPTPTAAPPTTDNDIPSRPTPLRDAATAVRSADRPSLKPPVRGDSEPGPLRSILPDRPGKVERPERPHPLRSLLADPVPLPIDPLPVDPVPIDPGATEPQPAAPVPGEPTPSDPTPVDPTPDGGPQVPDRDSRPSLRETSGTAKDAVTPGDDNVAGHDPTLLRRRNG
jgi:hypothetical protein